MPRIVLLSLCLLAIGGCSDFYLQSTPAPLARASFAASTVSLSEPSRYTVKSGDTLYAIARRSQHSPQQLARLNRLSPPYTLYPGQHLQLAETALSAPQTLRSTTNTNASNTNTNNANASNAISTHSNTNSAYVAGHFPPDCRAGGQWQWPVRGYQSVNYSRNTGLKIYGSNGQSVHAAAPGKVIYSGPAPGLSGHYSNLVILQHNSAYHSVYAGNRSVRVSEGTYVNAGQALAEMGSGSQQRAVLQFEIRCHDKSVDPLRYLPRSK